MTELYGSEWPGQVASQLVEYMAVGDGRTRASTSRFHLVVDHKVPTGKAEMFLDQELIWGALSRCVNV